MKYHDSQWCYLIKMIFLFFLPFSKLKTIKGQKEGEQKFQNTLKKNPFCNLGMRDLFLVYDLVYGFCLTVVRGFCKSQNISEDI